MLVLLQGYYEFFFAARQRFTSWVENECQKKIWLRNSEIGEECRRFWSEFFGAAEGLKPWRNKDETFAEDIR